MVKIAVFPASSEVGLEVIRSLSDNKLIELHAFDSVEGHAKHLCKNYHITAWINYLQPDHFKDFDFVYPTNELAVLKGFDNAVSHPFETIEICNSKLLTYQTFKGIAPELYPNTTWVKPVTGHSGIGQYQSKIEGLNCEYLSGEEFTVDCFTQGELKFVGPRTRSEIRSGIATKSQTVDLNDEILYIANCINNFLKFTGSWFFQCKRSAKGELKLLEIGARVAGSSGLTRAMGVNLPLLHVYHAMGIEVTMPYVNRVKITRALDIKCEFPKVRTLYFDWDDTIEIDGKINWKAIALAYKSGLPCYILTKGDNAQSIPPFITVIKTDNKIQYALKDNMLIDDSFSERKGWHHAISPSEIDLYL